MTNNLVHEKFNYQLKTYTMRTKGIKKTIRITTVLLGVVVASAMLLNSCKKENPVAKDTLSDGYITKSAFSCDVSCIDIGGPYFEKSDQKTVTYGPNSKTIDIIYYNTETDFVIKVKSTKSWSDLEIDGTSVWTGGTVAANTWGVYSYPLDIDWEACDVTNFELKVIGSGPQAIFNVSYSLIGLCEGCDTEFIGQAITCETEREAIYKFTSADALDYIKIQGGLTNFTGSDAEVIVTGGNLIDTQSTNGGSSNRVIKIEGSVDSCEEITIRIRWNSTNSGGIITGNWSVKDANGNELAPSVDGLECD